MILFDVILENGRCVQEYGYNEDDVKQFCDSVYDSPVVDVKEA